jgi:hypothetical protein
VQEPLKSRKSKKTIIAVTLSLLALAGLTTYILIYRTSSTPPLTNGDFMVSYSAISKINETISAGFSVWNNGASPLTMENVEVCFTDDQIELVEATFVKVYPSQGPSSLLGTPEQNGYVTYPVAGYIVEPKQEAQLYVALRAYSIGYHSATKIIFIYTYLGLRYKFTYNIEDYFTLEVNTTQ